MNTSKLLEYLSIIIDLEKNRYAQQKTINSLNKNISSFKAVFSTNVQLNEIVKLDQKNTSKFKNVKVDKSGKWIMYLMVYYMAFQGGALGYHIFSNIKALITGAVIGAIIPILIWKRILKKRREQAIIQIKREMRTEDELNQSRQLKNKQISLAMPKLEAEMQAMQKTYNLTCQALKKCYDINIIPVKYRNIVPVCMFYDYISNGRTYCLKRNPNAFDEGAINMYEQELFRNVVMDKLDIIINQLDNLRENQKVLCRVIEEGNRQTHKLLNDINSNVTKVNDNLQTIQYQNEQRNKCLEYMSYVTYQRYMS